MTYSAPLDGIRAVAILGVLAFHVTPRGVPGGFTGVDVFFTLSGYLITSLILRSLAGDDFSFREFYLRRIQRIIPNLVATALFVLAAWNVLMLPSSAAQTGRHGVWTLLSAANVFVWRYLGNYWGTDAETAPLTHAWSLAIEEQFYLFYPAFLVTLHRLGRTWLVVGLTAATLTSAAACGWLTPTRPVAAFYLLPTRGWELLIGGLLAVVRDGSAWPGHGVTASLARRVHDLVGFAALAVMIGGYWLMRPSTPFPAWGAIPSTLATAAVICATTAGPLTQRILSNRFLVEIGKRSYSLYLWHWPLIILGKHHAERGGWQVEWGALAGAAVSLGMAEVAYRLIETPLRERGEGRGKRLALIGAAFATALGFAAYLGYWHAIVADPTGRFEQPRFSGLIYSAGRPDPGVASSVKYYDVKMATPPPTAEPPWRDGGVIRLHGGPVPQVVVLGSSHALMYSPLIDDLCRERKLSVAFLGIDQTAAIAPRTLNPTFRTVAEVVEFDELRKRKLCEWRPAVVFLIDRWDLRADSAEAFRAELHDFVADAARCARRIVFVAQVPAAGVGDAVNLREYVTNASRFGDTCRIRIDERERLRRSAVRVAAELSETIPQLRVLRPDTRFHDTDGSLRFADGRRFLYADDDHLTDEGAEETRDLFAAELPSEPGTAPP